jgi:hypothetical protein
MIEVLRACPLRGLFEVSDGYERRMGFAARVGTAFHQTLQWLAGQPGLEDATLIAATRRRFLEEISEQEKTAAARPREQHLPRDDGRIDRALEAAMTEAVRLTRAYGEQIVVGDAGVAVAPNLHDTLEPANHSTGAEGEVEIPVRSRDGLLIGRVDRIESTNSGARLIDYKSALRDDLPERYERQLQLYAALWHDTWGAWPADAQVIYPLTGTTYTIDVEVRICEGIAAEAANLVRTLLAVRRPAALARPGDVCVVCEFRPWCHPFWRAQAAESSHAAALVRATVGFEGVVEAIELRGDAWRLQVRWRGCTVRFVLPKERFEHLAQVRPGMQLRILDTPLRGLRQQPTATITPRTEVFIVEGDTLDQADAQ